VMDREDDSTCVENRFPPNPQPWRRIRKCVLLREEVFLKRLARGHRLFVTYQWGNPQLDEVENAEGEAIPR
jgi:hypothetical protein